jgi:nanoRNase/pAp phosphatase (c-di-AMP/oligoRNAs hydrolase)
MTNVLEDLWSGRTLVLSHRNADIDALGCSIALASMFPDVTIGAVESISRGAQNLLSAFEGRYEVAVDPFVDDDLSPYDRIVFVDTSSTRQVEPYDKFLGSSIVIDHHMENPSLRTVNPKYHFESDSPSCAQIVHRLAVDAGAEVDRDAALALVAGILADTERLRIAPNSAVRHALEILEEGGLELTDVIQAIERPVYDRSRAIAMLKAANRTEHHEIGDFLMAISHVGAFEASAARFLVAMGADVALVASEEGGTTSLTGRVGRRALDAGFHLAQFLRALGERTGGGGGGHAGAAGFSAPKPMSEVCDAAVVLAREVLPGLSVQEDAA